MRDWDARHLAAAAGATLVRAPSGALAPGGAGRPGPARASIDSRTLAPGELFVGLRGERADGGAHAAQALEAGAWGVLVAPEHARAARRRRASRRRGARAPRSAARACRRSRVRGGASSRARGAMVVAITGSTGKTSTKDILAALLGPAAARGGEPAEPQHRDRAAAGAAGGAGGHASVLVLEMAMRGAGQIAELTAIAEPDVGVIVNVGPGAPRAARLARGDRGGQGGADRGAGARVRASVVPAGEPLLAPHLRADLPRSPSARAATCRWLERRADGAVRDRARRRARSSCGRRSRRRTTSATCSPRWRPRGRSGYTPRGRARGALLGDARASAIALPGGVVRDRRLLQRQPDVHARGDRRPRRDGAAGVAWRCSATCSSWGRRRRACTARSARTRARAASSCS